MRIATGYASEISVTDANAWLSSGEAEIGVLNTVRRVDDGRALHG